MKIPVFAGRNAVEMADDLRARQLMRAKNVQVVTERKTGRVVRLIIKSHSTEEVADNSAPESGETSSVSRYKERIDGAQFGGIHVLAKTVHPALGFQRWDDGEGFNPKRFNPDRIAAPLRQS